MLWVCRVVCCLRGRLMELVINHRALTRTSAWVPGEPRELPLVSQKLRLKWWEGVLPMLFDAQYLKSCSLR